MKFWDSSAIIPLLVAETETERTLTWLAEDPEVVVWWGTRVECASALARLEREGLAERPALKVAFDRLRERSDTWHEVQPVESVRHAALRLLRVHSLRAADAFQLAAALIAAENHSQSLSFVCLDTRLTAAAEREGFTVLGTEA